MGATSAGSADNSAIRSRRHPLLAAALSALVPGLGQFYAARRRRGLWLLAVVVATLLVVGVWLVRDPKVAVKLAFEPSVLVGLLVVNALVFFLRVWATVDAYRLLAPLPASAPVTGAAFVIIGLVLLVPHGWFAYYDAVQYDLINTVFTATTAPPTTTTPDSTTAPASNVDPVTATSTTTTTTTTTQPPKLWEGLERLNILLLGSDSGVGRTGVRTDTMILASFDVATGDLALISIPRNFARVPLPESVDIFSCGCFPPILNELYLYGEDHPDSFPGPATPGANAIKGAVAELTGLPVHYYAMVALDGFVDVVDAIGGVTITVTERVYDPAYPSEDGGTEIVEWQPGTYAMDGHDALTYARTRHSDDDYHRMGRQRCVVEAVLEQANPFALLRNYPTLAGVIKETVETDIPLDAVPDLIDLVAIVNTEEAVSLPLVPPTYVSGWTEEGFNIPNLDVIREHIQIATSLPAAAAIERLGLELAADACG